MKMSSFFLRTTLGSKALRRCAASSCFSRINLNLNTAKTAVVNPSTPLHRYYCVKVQTETQKKSIKDNVGVGGTEVIYTGQLSRSIMKIKFFSITTSFFGLTAQPVVYYRALSAGVTSKFTLPAFGVVAAFAIISPLLLHYITKRYIIEVEYDPKNDKYFATTYNLFVRKKRVEFTPDDVTIPTVLGMFTTCAIKGKPVFLDAKSFNGQKHYVRIMGYDRPIFDIPQKDNIIDDEDDEDEPRTKKK